jgi:hypothetical protein
MTTKPRGRAKRKAWLRRRIVVLEAQLARGFLETYFCDRHWTVAAQVKQCHAQIEAARAELEPLLD